MTRKDRILKYLKNPRLSLSCQEICSKIIYDESLEGNKARYLSGGVSSILAKLVKEGVLKYSTLLGPRGGHMYQLNKK